MQHQYKPTLNLKGVDVTRRAELVNAVWDQADELEVELPDLAWELAIAENLEAVMEVITANFGIQR